MTDLLDPRQRLAACLVMSGIDLPAPADEVAAAWICATRLSPGVLIRDVPLGDRRACLLRARDLIEEMLAEIPSPDLEPPCRTSP